MTKEEAREKLKKLRAACRTVAQEVEMTNSTEYKEAMAVLYRETPIEHDLKIYPAYFGAVASGIKTFEYRLDDRDYQVGDTLLLREYFPKDHSYSGREVRVKVTYILRTGGYAIMSIVKQ